MSFAPLNRVFRSLRFRLTSWNTAVVFVAVVVALLAVRNGLRYSLEREIGMLLMEEAQVASLAVAQLYPHLEEIHREMDRMALGHAERGWFLQLLDQDGHPLWSGVNVPEHLPPLDHTTSPEILRFGGRRMAQLAVPSARASMPQYYVRVGTGVDFIDRDVQRLTQITVPVGLVVLLLAPLGGYLLAGRATRPLNAIIAAAAKVRPNRLGDRLPLRGTGDELDQLSATINQLLDRIAVHLEHSQQFVDNAAHELRSPLAAIQASVEVALANERTVEEYQELLYLVIDQCQALAAVVNQLLLLAETDAERAFPREMLSFDVIVQQTIEIFRDLAEERGIRLEQQIAPGVIVRAHPGRLRQVIINLLDNGLKFSKPGGCVRVELWADAAQGRALLRISDRGRGIEADQMPRIFDRFFRVRDVRGRVAGSGLGLPICKSIVEAHGGQIEAQSTLGQGTTFTISLPLISEAARAGQPISRPMPA